MRHRLYRYGNLPQALRQHYYQVELLLRSPDEPGNARWLERTMESGPLQCDYVGARALIISQRKEQPLPPKGISDGPRQYAPVPPPSRPGVITAEADLSSNELQDFNDNLPDILKAAAEMNSSVTFRLRMELTGTPQPSSEAIGKINRLLQEVSSKLKLVS